MKKVSSVVWKFFERVEENSRCVAVICKLCETQYKYFGNTTNLRVHLINRHPVQWELSENGTLDESTLPALGTPNTSTPTKRSRSYKPRGSSSKHVDPNSDTNEDEESTLNLVRQMHGDQNSDEEWLDDAIPHDPYHITHIETYEPQSKRKRKFRKIKREVTSPSEVTSYYIPKPEKIYTDTSKKDEYSVFGEYVANKLRKIKTPRTCGNLQQLITTILWQAEYGLYDNADTVKRVLLMNLQTDQTEYEVQSAHTEEPQTEVTIENASPDCHSRDSISVLN